MGFNYFCKGVDDTLKTKLNVLSAVLLWTFCMYIFKWENAFSCFGPSKKNNGTYIGMNILYIDGMNGLHCLSDKKLTSGQFDVKYL